MTWKRALRNLFRFPFYLVMSLLPSLLVGLLLFPLYNRFGAITRQIVDFIRFGRFDRYFLETAGRDLIYNLLPIFLIILGIAMLSAVIDLVIAPVSLQYLGDATRYHRVPGDFASRGMRRIWWKPFVLSLFISAAISSLSGFVSFFNELGSHSAVLRMLGFLFSLAYLGASFLLALMLPMVYASITMEDRPFFKAIGVSIKRVFRYVWRMIGANCAVSGILMSVFLFVFLVIGGQFLLTLEWRRLASPDYLMDILPSILNRFALFTLVFMIYRWMHSSFMIAYCMELTREDQSYPPIRTTSSPVSPAPAPLPQNRSMTASGTHVPSTSAAAVSAETIRPQAPEQDSPDLSHPAVPVEPAAPPAERPEE